MSIPDRVFHYATGWLGWSANDALNTPMPQIFHALNARIEFLEKTNPFGSGKKENLSKKTRNDLSALALIRSEMASKNNKG